MDVLSEVLRVVKLEGALFFNAEFTAPWGVINSGVEGLAQYLSPRPCHLIIYHFITEGRAYTKLLEGKHVDLTAGDIVVYPHGNPHLLGNGFARPVDSLKTFSPGLDLVKYGGGGEVTRIVCGYLACDPRLSEVFLACLPPVLKVHLVKDVSDQWLENSIRFAVSEANGPNPGGDLIHARLAELLFVETLRRYINRLPHDEIGWLAGARDTTIGQALALLHKDPAHPWTISSLAREVGLSRTRLAERFRHFLAESPMAYLARWRLKLAAEILQSTEDSVAEVAVAVGYESEAGFNRAFKREFNCPPAQFRRKHKDAPHL